MPSSGQLALSTIRDEFGAGTTSNVSLRTLSAAAGLSVPDGFNEFYGLSAWTPPVLTNANGWSVSGSGTAANPWLFDSGFNTPQLVDTEFYDEFYQPDPYGGEEFCQLRNDRLINDYNGQPVFTHQSAGPVKMYIRLWDYKISVPAGRNNLTTSYYSYMFYSISGWSGLNYFTGGGGINALDAAYRVYDEQTKTVTVGEQTRFRYEWWQPAVQWCEYTSLYYNPGGNHPFSYGFEGTWIQFQIYFAQG